MPILEEYKRQVLQKQLMDDPAQQQALQQLARLQQQLADYNRRCHTLSHKLQVFFRGHSQMPQGLYLWGGVGRGKTWLMDMFFDTLDIETRHGKNKLRLHFHHFMRSIHDQLSLIGERKNPLRDIARSFAERHRLLCLDEFHVSDISDAMLLSGLLHHLFSQGVVIVATSNQPPDELYKNGLQRERFLPAIELIKRHMTTLPLPGKTDHRLRLLEQSDSWLISSDHSQAELERSFNALATSPAQRNQSLHINYRKMHSLMLSSDIIWFDFDALCGDQRGPADYIELARQYHSILISNIPQMDDSQNDRAKRFITLIDEFYDRRVKLFASAATSPQLIYTGQRLAFEFQRTVSRLLEMRSHEYMQQAHKSG